MTAWLAIIAPAWIAGSILALLSAPLGCLVLWRRMAFFADALAHGTLLGVALAVWWQLPMGIGILLELDWADLPLIATSVLVGLGLLIYIWPAQIKLATHEALARIQGINPTRQRLFFMGVLAGFCAIALQAVGSLLISGLLVLPALTARLWSASPKQMVIIALIIAQLGVTLGVWGSIWFDIQTGLAIVLVLAILFFMALIISKLISKKSGTKSLMAKFWSPRH